MCRNYLACDPDTRDEIRRFVCERSDLVELVFGYVVKLTEQIKQPEDVAKLRIGVTAVSIISAGCDWRDVVYVALGGLYRRARRRRIDAKAVLREIADYSSEVPLPYTGTSIAKWLRDFKG